MIKYALICERDHEFESWFANADSFDSQVKRGFVECPHCQSKKISKALMAPSVSTSRRRGATRVAAAMESAAAEQVARLTTAETTAPAVAPPVAPIALVDEKHQQMRAMIRELHQKLTENSTDVGANFASEARAIHDGDAPQRSIHGKATLDEARSLADEGIPVMPLPVLPDERN